LQFSAMTRLNVTLVLSLAVPTVGFNAASLPDHQAWSIIALMALSLPSEKKCART
jgi:hypothetical protein